MVKKNGNILFRNSTTCRVCGDVARDKTFNVLTCMSCKTFFRRFANRQSLIPSCQFRNSCNITKKTRSHCAICRLKKCLAFGMNPAIVQNISGNDDNNSSPNDSNNAQQQVQVASTNEIRLPTPSPLNLLRADRSILASNEWTLLSNIVHAFDHQHTSSKIQSFLHQLTLRPPKLRLRSSDTYHMVGEFFTGVQSLIECSPDLNGLSANACRALMKHNLSTIGALNGIFLCRELDLYNNSTFFYASSANYGAEFLLNCSQNSSRCDPNGSLIKMILFVLTFSTNCSIVAFDHKESISTMSCTLDLLQIQNIYVAALWKYLIYRYEFKEATLRYCSLIKSILDVNHMLELMPKNEVHDSMVEAIAAEAEHALVIKD